MSEIINIPNQYQKSEILNNVDFPKNETENQIQQTISQSKKIQKNIIFPENSEEKRKKRRSKVIQKEK